MREALQLMKSLNVCAIHLQTLKVKVKILCDVFEKHEFPPSNGMLTTDLFFWLLLRAINTIYCSH